MLCQILQNFKNGVKGKIQTGLISHPGVARGGIFHLDYKPRPNPDSNPTAVILL